MARTEDDKRDFRDFAAAMVLQGLIASGEINLSTGGEIIKTAIDIADKLCKKLDEPKKSG